MNGYVTQFIQNVHMSRAIRVWLRRSQKHKLRMLGNECIIDLLTSGLLRLASSRGSPADCGMSVMMETSSPICPMERLQALPRADLANEFKRDHDTGDE